MSGARHGSEATTGRAVVPAARDLDVLPAEKVVDLLLAQEETVARAVRRQRAVLADAARLVAAALVRGGRLLYAGAGTAGRLAAIDAVECATTFALPPSRIIAVVSGGPRALLRAVGDEEDGHDAETRLRAAALGPRDVLCVLAVHSDPFAAAALAYARRRHSRTIVLATGPYPATAADVVVAVPTGPEVVADDPWLKSATAAKLMLAALSTTTMVLVGKTCRGVVLDVASHSPRGRERAIAVVREFTGLDEKAAGTLLERAGGRPKLAIIMHHRRVTRARAEALVIEHTGSLRAIIGAEKLP